jgi:hypothetical protein
MSFDLVQLGRLQAAGGAALAKYERLLSEAAGAQFDSPALRAWSNL